MKKISAALFAIVFAGLAACSALGAQGIPGQGIKGLVLLGPHCPVVQEGEKCPDTPYHAELVVTNIDGTREVKKFSSDANGMFAVLLPVGQYIIRSPGDVSLPYCDSGPLTVRAGAMTETIVFCDTGIR